MGEEEWSEDAANSIWYRDCTWIQPWLILLDPRSHSRAFIFVKCVLELSLSRPPLWWSPSRCALKNENNANFSVLIAITAGWRFGWEIRWGWRFFIKCVAPPWGKHTPNQIFAFESNAQQRLFYCTYVHLFAFRISNCLKILSLNLVTKMSRSENKYCENRSFDYDIWFHNKTAENI